MKEIKIYIASPYTKGDTAMNVRFQMDIADQLIELGFYPFTPLYFHFQHMFKPRHYTDWMKMDFVWLAQCDCVIRFYPVQNGELLGSHGADLEEQEAKRLGIPVFYSIEEVVNYYK